MSSRCASCAAMVHCCRLPKTIACGPVFLSFETLSCLSLPHLLQEWTSCSLGSHTPTHICGVLCLHCPGHASHIALQNQLCVSGCLSCMSCSSSAARLCICGLCCCIEQSACPPDVWLIPVTLHCLYRCRPSKKSQCIRNMVMCRGSGESNMTQ